MKFYKLLLGLGFIMFVCVSCGPSKSSVRYGKIEVAPGKYATLRMNMIKMDRNTHTATISLEIKYNEQIINFGNISDTFRPECIMEYGNLLYIIIWTFEEINFPYLVFYKQEGTSFKRIEASEFPKQIAIQNVWFPGDGIRRGTVVLDHLKTARDRNINSEDFRGSLTAQLWRCLETKEPFYDIFCYDVDSKLLQGYIDKYNPVRLKFEEIKFVDKKAAGFPD